MHVGEGGAGERRPLLEFDHVQVAVPDLEDATEAFLSRYGLSALPGGRHPGRGTANLIVPLGESYIELIAVVDQAEAERVPTSLRVSQAVRTGRTFATWVVRTSSLEDTRATLRGFDSVTDAASVSQGLRRLPGGEELSWRNLELVPEARFSPLPFLIEWHVPPERFPGATSVRHESGARGFDSIVLSDPEPDSVAPVLNRLLSEDMSYSTERGRAGVSRLLLDTPSGPLVID